MVDEGEWFLADENAIIIYKLYKMVYFIDGIEKLKDEWIEIDLEKEIEFLRENFAEINIELFIEELEENLKGGKIVGTLYGTYKTEGGN